MDESLRDPEGRRSARRRLLKGSFSAPAMLVLTSGSAWANASSSRCVRNEVGATTQPAGALQGSFYVQVQIYEYNKTSDPTKASRWVKGQDLVAIAGAGKTRVLNDWITSTQYLCMVGGAPPAGSTSYAAGNVYNPGTTTGSSVLFAPPEADLMPLAGYYAVKFDDQGNVVGVDNQIKAGSGGGAVHASCWSSFVLRTV